MDPPTYTGRLSEIECLDQTRSELKLSLPEALRVVEATVQFLNKNNNELQQHIRTNKDKENQEIRDEIDKVIKLLNSQVEEEPPEALDTHMAELRRKGVLTKIKLLEQILEAAYVWKYFDKD